MKSSSHPVLTGALCGALAGVFLVPWLASLTPSRISETWTTDSTAVAREVARLEAATNRLKPSGPYLVVSTTDNTFRLMAGADTLREGICSTGSYVKLDAADGRSWLFQTPRGRFRVLDKRTNPVWSKPDWAFVEAGLPVPPAGHPSRYERGVLGRYALALGDGYLVHGTPYQRLLGQPVTHGCVRLGDVDLQAVFMAMGMGAPVYMY
ncbi:MAG: L,D-transpeptidase [Rhodothermales bacterium]|nr:L,D-transpeptidase [Rhodothermales bacterium]MBO6778368.1 L,D-transpeptidase [Rhodothermales bacterium]